jgi:hypothetical protein
MPICSGSTPVIAYCVMPSAIAWRTKFAGSSGVGVSLAGTCSNAHVGSGAFDPP